jgi:hypothetical protein
MQVQQPETAQQQPQQSLPGTGRMGENAVRDQQYREGNRE